MHDVLGATGTANPNSLLRSTTLRVRFVRFSTVKPLPSVAWSGPSKK
jgi:hypothetical protein